MSVAWIQLRRQTLCEVPWLGTVAILSDGSVNFCCYSSVIVGNVNRSPFEEIWNSATMQTIRRELTDGRFPPECRSNSCPIYRGDQDYRPGGGPTQIRDPEAFRGSGLRETGDGLCLALELCYRGQPIEVDLFAAIVHPDATIRFLPDFETYALPLLCGVPLREDQSAVQIPIVGRTTQNLPAGADWQISVALFESGSNPNDPEKCYWSETRTIAGGAADRKDSSCPSCD